MAFKYLSWALFPLFGCYAVYSLVYNEHKGWYSFCLGICYGFLLMFGISYSNFLTTDKAYPYFFISNIKNCLFTKRFYHDDSSIVYKL